MRMGGVVAVLVCGAALMGQGKAASPAVDEVKVEGTHLEQSSRCTKDGVIRVAATESRLSILGDCRDVIVEGSSNWILVEHAKRIVMHGARNTVMYRSTRVEDRGMANSVAEKWPQ